MLKILLADDDIIEQTGISFLFEKNQIQADLSYAENGEQALQMLQNDQFDLLITDIKMPLMDGVELVKRIRDFNKELPILVISGYEDFMYAKKLLRYHVLDYLIKPINFHDFIQVINRILELQPQETQGVHSDNEAINQVIQIIRDEFDTPLTLETVASRIFLSPGYLSQKFKELTGVNFNKYLMDVRLEHALTLLTKTNMKVSKIAEKCGFSNASYFNRVFKRKKSMQPLEYRERKGN